MWQRIKDWWRYSRTIFLNVAVGSVALVAELVQFLVGFDWSAIMSARAAAYVVLAVNVLNIILRLDTNGPVGSK